MFFREKNNNSGSISIQVLKKVGRKNVLVKTIGSTKDPERLSVLRKLAKEFIDSQTNQLPLDLNIADSRSDWFNLVRSSIQFVHLVGPELILGRLFNEIGFDQISDQLFRHLTISRIIYPSSKLKTIRYLMEYEMKSYSVDQVYRYMDKLEDRLKQKVEQISFDHTCTILNGEMNVVFYDVTTIYFEAEKEDDLRITGFSKEGKHKHPQILLGLLVSMDGYPLAYQIFEGNKYEGHTMLTVIEQFKLRFKIDRLVIIADSGLMNNKNIDELIGTGQEFIIGARIKSESKLIKDQIKELALKNKKTFVIKKSDEVRLVVAYSQSRAKKDAFNRKRGLQRLEDSLAKGKLTKSNINNRGYNKYLKLKGSINISIDYEKYEQDARWDGLKGYITNTSLNSKTLINSYNELWQIEKAFRISKTDLKIRPVYHRIERRIKAHICISFVAYKLYKELERQLKLLNSKLSTQRTIELMKTIYGIKIKHPVTQKSDTIIHTNNKDQKYLLELFKIKPG